MKAKEIYEKYSKHRQTLRYLGKEYGKTEKTIRKYLDRYFAVTGEIKVPQIPVNLVLDATFFGRKGGVLVARADGKNVFWREIETESIAVYESFLGDYTYVGGKLLSCTIDGRRGVLQLICRMFPGLPVQLCQFHQIQIITRYLSKRPKLLAGKTLRNLTLLLTKTTKEEFIYQLNQWHHIWKEFLKEKTMHPQTGRRSYTHRRIRSAYRSLKTNLPWLFTYQDHPHLNIPNTTNSCDGSFAHWKNKIKIHRGLSPKRKRKMILFFLENS